MPIQQTYKTGTITVAPGSAVVTGFGTAWLLGLVNGGLLSFNGFSVPIVSVESNTSLTLDYPAPAAMAGSGTYSIVLGRADAASAIVANRQLSDLTNLLSAGVSPFVRTVLDDLDAPAVRGTLGLPALFNAKADKNAGTFTGNPLFLSGYTGNLASIASDYNAGGAVIRSQDGGAALLGFHVPTAGFVYFGLDSDLQWKIGGFSYGAQSHKLWHAGNDGAGSGLDADLLDGLQSAYAASGSTIPIRDGEGDLSARLFRSQYADDGSSSPDYIMTQVEPGVTGIANNFIRPMAMSRFRTALLSTQQITDWNNILKTGTYMAPTALNSPVENIWWIGHVVAHNDAYVIQTLTSFTTQTATNSQTYRRFSQGGVWSNWVKLDLFAIEQGSISVDANRVVRRDANGDVFARKAYLEGVGDVRNYIDQRRKLLQVVDLDGTSATQIITTIPTGVRSIRITGIARPSGNSVGSQVQFSFDGGATYPGATGTYAWNYTILGGGNAPAGSNVLGQFTSIPLTDIHSGIFVNPRAEMQIDCVPGGSVSFSSKYTRYEAGAMSLVLIEGAGPIGVPTHMRIATTDGSAFSSQTRLLIEGF